jgi:hypothetical protein
MTKYEVITRPRSGYWYGVNYWEDEGNCALVACFPSVEQANEYTERYAKQIQGYLVQTVYLAIEQEDNFQYILIGADDE